MGWMRSTDALTVLRPLLGSTDGPVRVAAAMSVIRLLSPQRLSAAVAPRRDAASEPAGVVKPPALKTSGAKD
jgi:hypothetical protein